MRKFLKRFVKLSWRGIPIGIIASVLITTAVLAAILVGVTQHIGQEIVEEAPPPNYGSITAPSFDLANVLVSGTVSQTATAGVVVELLADGVGENLHLILDENSTALYSVYEVELFSAAAGNPMSVDITLTVTKGGTLDDSIALTTAGIYTFDETITATAGASPGTADVIVDVNLGQ